MSDGRSNQNRPASYRRIVAAANENGWKIDKEGSVALHRPMVLTCAADSLDVHFTSNGAVRSVYWHQGFAMKSVIGGFREVIAVLTGDLLWDDTDWAGRKK